MRLPTRRIEKNTALRIQRTLPLPGEIFVRAGQTVAPADIIGRAALPSHYTVVNVARELRQPHPDIMQVMQKQAGMDISAGEILAKLPGRLRLGKRTCISPVDGVIAAIVGYRVLIETEARWTELPALVHGVVESVQHTLGVTVSTNGDAIDGACAFGQDAFGELVVPASLEDDTANFAGKILLIPEPVTPSVIQLAESAGAHGIIAGSVVVAAVRTGIVVYDGACPDTNCQSPGLFDTQSIG